MGMAKTVGKRCLKCGHLRAPDDVGPDWGCPACGAVYAKMEALERGDDIAIRRYEAHVELGLLLMAHLGYLHSLIGIVDDRIQARLDAAEGTWLASHFELQLALSEPLEQEQHFLVQFVWGAVHLVLACAAVAGVFLVTLKLTGDHLVAFILAAIALGIILAIEVALKFARGASESMSSLRGWYLLARGRPIH